MQAIQLKSLFTCLVLFSVFTAVQLLDPDMTKTFDQLVQSHGFILKAYNVTTFDGYILTVHRVVPPDFNATTYNQNRKPVIVHHGMQSSAPDFFTNSPFIDPEAGDTCGDNFGFCLVMTGRYDIWLPNSRGTDYSTGYKYPASLLTYWNFGWDQMVTYDVPAVISFVQTTTGHQKLGWVGHSQGTTIMFALLSMQPQYANIIQPFVAWAPPIFIGNMSSPLKSLTFIEHGLMTLGGKYVMATEIYQLLQQYGCIPVPSLCAASITGILGQTDSLNTSRIPVYDHFYPSGTSSWDVAQFMQQIIEDDFYRLDYGNFFSNEAAYGLGGAVPKLNLANIPAGFTIALMYGNTDAYVPLSGVARLKQILQTGGVNVIDYNVPKTLWNHVDFIWGMGAGGLVYDKTVEILDQITAQN